MSNFTQALAFVLKNEGGFVDDPADAGGATNMGITLRTLEAWRKRTDPYAEVTVIDIQNLSIAGTTSIYCDLWWKPMGLEAINSVAAATAIFDAAVLFGVLESATCAQRAVNVALSGISLAIDGILGPDSFDGLNAVNDNDFLVLFTHILEIVIDDIEERHPQDKKFDNGWRSRINKYLSL